MTAVRLAVVGTKGMGRGHIKAIRALGTCALAAVCDVNPDESSACSAEFGVPGYTDLEQMLATEVVDGVCVCTPHWFHPTVTTKAFAAGVHVLTEKPIAVTVDDAEKMIEASHTSGKILAVVFQQRALPINVKAKEIIDSGVIGEIHRTLLIAPWYRTEAYYRSAAWRGTWKGEGGGVLLNQAPHSLDLFMWIPGMTPTRVIGQAETVRHAIEVEDRATALLRYASGATGYLYASTNEAPCDVRIEFAGDRGKLLIDDNTLKLCRLESSLAEHSKTCEEMWGEVKGTWKEIPVGEPTGLQGHEYVINDFAEAVRTGRKPMVTGEEALRSLELANAITLSSHRNEAVDIPIPRKAYSELVGLLSGRTTRRRRRTTARTKKPLAP